MNIDINKLNNDIEKTRQEVFKTSITPKSNVVPVAVVAMAILLGAIML